MNIRMNLPASAAVGLTLLSTICSSPILALTISVTEDVSVLGGTRANQNYENNAYKGGLFSGVDGAYSSANPSDAPARFYLQFTLPTLESGTTILSATLNGYYNNSYSMLNGLTFDQSVHHLYLANSNNWDSSTLTWNNQPGLRSVPIGSFIPDKSPGWRTWGITQAVKESYQAGNTLSIGFRADNENVSANNNDWVFFASHESDPNSAFYLELKLGGKGPKNTPEPTTCAYCLSAILCGGMLYRRRKMSH